jgi:hypothetical protein
MRTTLLSSLLFLGLVGAGGCTASGSAYGSATVTTPPLVFVSADVQVIENYHEPVFYSGNMYWRYQGGVWFSSRYHTRDWVRVSVVPAPIQRIETPTAYIRYRGSANVNANAQHREDKREIREMKQESKEAAKEERREDKAEAKEDRKELKEDRKETREDRKEVREDKKEAKEDRKEQKEDRKEAKEDKKAAKHGKR